MSHQVNSLKVQEEDLVMSRVYLNTLSEGWEACIKGHKHTDSACSIGYELSEQLSIGDSAGWVTEAHARAWVCLSCGKEFANMEALVKDSR